MAKPTQKQAELEELVRRSEASRLRLADAHSALKDKLNVPARLVSSMRAEPAKWLGGSAVAGFVTSRLFRSKKSPKKVREIKKQRNFLLGTLTLAAAVAKPAARIYATKLIKDYFNRQLADGTARRPASGNIPRY